MITIVDSGGANISSILFAFERFGVKAKLSRDAEMIKKSSHIILPGVGAAATTMNCLKQYALFDVLRSLTQPVLGICLGMQILFDFSAEENVECLNVIPGKITKLAGKKSLSVPHMGWNTLTIIKDNVLLKNISDQAYTYFAHSYFAPVSEYTTAITNYGETFTAAVQYKNFYGTQFHPERSSDVGMKIFQNFLEL